jgi:hypothetical protein
MIIDFTTDLDVVYQRHVQNNHPSMPVYPTENVGCEEGT